MNIAHVGLWVQNLETMKAFYEKYFDAKSSQLYHNSKKQFSSYFLTFDSGSRLELMHRPDIATNSGECLGYAHLAIALGAKERVDCLTEKFRTDGIEILDGPRTTGDGYYEVVILDPEGNRIELTA